MNYQDYVGYPLNVVEDIFKKKNIKYKVLNINSNKEVFDTLLVVKITENEEVNIYVDRFLLNI